MHEPVHRLSRRQALSSFGALVCCTSFRSLPFVGLSRSAVDARKFLEFVMRPDVQEILNRATLTIQVNTRAPLADDRFLRRGRELVSAADGLSQFYDRDTSEDLASIAMKGFQEFMMYPDRLESVLATIERARQRIYGSAAGAPATK